MKNIGILLSFILPALVFSEQADHLLLSRIVVTPDEAESISIINPTDEIINLSNYYICDDNEYFLMQTVGEMSPSHFINGFTAQFPNIEINPNDTLLLVLSDDYASFYTGITPDLFLFNGNDNSMLETEDGSFGLSSAKIDDDSESIILFSWDGNPESNIQDVDYFIWGGIQGAIDKSGEGNYLEDTSSGDQLYFEETHGDYYAFSRVSNLEEINEVVTGGNGITNHDETSEDLRQSWEIISLVTMGCTDPDAPNYDPEASIDDGSCTLSFLSIINNCEVDVIECDGNYDLANPSDCPLVNTQVSITGAVIDFYDITGSNGPYSFKIEDESGYRISFVVWPESNSYQDGFDILQTSLSEITEGPFGKFVIQITGTLDVYCRNANELDIFGDWQVVVEYEEDITILDIIDGEGDSESDLLVSTSINPAPFVIIPSLGETLDFTYSFTADSRVIIRIFNLNGQFITSLVDKYYPDAGKVVREENSSAWDGRDHLGQIVAPGTYIMHIETMNFTTGETTTDSAPIVVGVSH